MSNKAPCMAMYGHQQWCSQCPKSAVGSMLGLEAGRGLHIACSSLHLLPVPWVNQSTLLDYSVVFQRKQKNEADFGIGGMCAGAGGL